MAFCSLWLLAMEAMVRMIVVASGKLSRMSENLHYLDKALQTYASVMQSDVLYGDVEGSCP